MVASSIQTELYQLGLDFTNMTIKIKNLSPRRRHDVSRRPRPVVWAFGYTIAISKLLFPKTLAIATGVVGDTPRVSLLCWDIPGGRGYLGGRRSNPILYYH